MSAFLAGDVIAELLIDPTIVISCLAVGKLRFAPDKISVSPRGLFQVIDEVSCSVFVHDTAWGATRAVEQNPKSPECYLACERVSPSTTHKQTDEAQFAAARLFVASAATRSS